MTMTPSPIPDWYTMDWAPVRGRGELPALTWDAVETVVETLHAPGSAREAAQRSFRTLKRESAGMAPMDLLQALLTTAARAIDPNRSRLRALEPDDVMSPPAGGPLPRWSFSDLEVAMSHIWSGLALTIANRRHHELLMHRGEPLTPVEITQMVFLLVAGLPSRSAAKARASEMTRENLAA